MTYTNDKNSQEQNNVQRLEAKVDALADQVKILVDSQKMLGSLYEDMVPIMTSAIGTGAAQMADLEKRGYFDFARESMHVLDAVVTGYTPDDVHALAENVVHILDLVKTLTQPDVLEFAENAAEAAEGEGEKKPKGIIGMLRATAKDDDVKRGLAIGLEALRQLGKRANAAAHANLGDHRVSALLGAKRNLKTERPKASPRAPHAATAHAAPPPQPAPVASSVSVSTSPTTPVLDAAAQEPGIAFDGQGFLQDPGVWDEEIGASLAESLGVPELNEHHWQVLRFARKEFEEKGVSPNIRRITTGAGVPTKDLYSLFPRAPAKTVAKIAGIPKPVGCI